MCPVLQQWRSAGHSIYPVWPKLGPVCFPWGLVLGGQQCDPRDISRCEVDKATSPASGSHAVGFPGSLSG